MKIHRDQHSGSFQIKRSKQANLISIFNPNGYLMAQYNEKSGVTSWQRVVPAAQKLSLERQVTQQFPRLAVLAATN